MTTRVQLVTPALTAASRRGAFPLDEPIEPVEPVETSSLVVRPGTRSLRGPELRCAQMADALALDAESDALLAEWNLGRWGGRRLEDVTATEPDAVTVWMTDPTAAPHGGESLIVLLARSRSWLDGLGDATIVAVTHPALVRAFVTVALDAGPAAFWRLDVAPGTATSLSGRDGRWNVTQVGSPLRFF